MMNKDYQIIVYDDKDKITLVIPVAEHLDLSIAMTDECAQRLIDTIQNKLNGRF